VRSTEDLMKELKYFYEPIPHIYNKKDKNYVYLKDGVWQVIKMMNGALNVELETKSRMDVLVFLIDNKADLNEFDRLMVGCIKTRYIHLKSQMKKIEKIFSVEELLKAEDDWESFCKGIVGIVKKETSGFKVIKGGK